MQFQEFFGLQAIGGFGDGLEEDAYGVRLLAENVDEAIITSSCSKNFGIYCERTGCLILIAKDEESMLDVRSQAAITARENYSNPPAHGGAVVIDILEDDSTFLGDTHSGTYREMLPDQSWYVSSISKTLTPALRIGFAIAPHRRRTALRRVAENGFFGLARPLADLTEDLLTRPETREVVRAVQAQNAAYVRATVNALGGFDLGWDEDSPFVWLRLPAGWRAASFCMAAEAQGVQVRPAEDFAPRNAFAPHAVRIGMNGLVAMSDFEAALARLRALLDNPPEQILV
mgnify:CR=1 FL=1